MSKKSRSDRDTLARRWGVPSRRQLRVGAFVLSIVAAAGSAAGQAPLRGVFGNGLPVVAPTAWFTLTAPSAWETHVQQLPDWERLIRCENCDPSLLSWSDLPIAKSNWGRAIPLPLLETVRLELSFPDFRSWRPRPTARVWGIGWSQRTDCVAPTASFRRVGGESTQLTLLGCDGMPTAEALDAVSSLARTRGTPAPQFPLPIQPTRNTEEPLEWIPGIRLLHPRLFALLQQVVQAFPGRELKIYSGYRRDGDTSYHRKGRAVDLAIAGVSNEELFQFCRTLVDAGCGYYPNSKFVHIDARPRGTGHAIWIDASGPGEPARYVDSWPGVLESGGYSWAPRVADANDSGDAK